MGSARRPQTASAMSAANAASAPCLIWQMKGSKRSSPPGDWWPVTRACKQDGLLLLDGQRSVRRNSAELSVFESFVSREWILVIQGRHITGGSFLPVPGAPLASQRLKCKSFQTADGVCGGTQNCPPDSRSPSAAPRSEKVSDGGLRASIFLTLVYRDSSGTCLLSIPVHFSLYI